MCMRQYNPQWNSNIDTQREHQNSNFTLGGENINSRQSLQNSTLISNQYRQQLACEQMRLSSTTPDFQIYDNRNIYLECNNGIQSRPVIQLERVEVNDPMAAPAPVYYQNIGQGLQNSESVHKLFREEEMPSVIHRNTITQSRDSLIRDESLNS